MDMVKAVINLKEGTLQLEGPQEFVEKYLDLYLPTVIEQKSTISQEAESIKERATTKRTRARTPRGTPSCLGRIRTLIDENYFVEPRISADVINWLKEQKGAAYSSGPVTAALNALIKSGALRRYKEGKSYKYCNP